MGFPSGSDSKASVCNAGDLGSIPGLGKSPGEGVFPYTKNHNITSPTYRPSLTPHFIFSGSLAGARITQELGEPILCSVENLPPDQQFLCIHDSASSDSTTSKLNICCLVAKLCLTLCDPMDCSPPGSSVHGMSQARILEWVTISSSRGSSHPRD